MKALRTIEVQPELPDRLSGLLELAYDFWWCWQPDVIQLFRRMDPELWDRTNHNPVLMLGSMQQDRFIQMNNDEGFIAQLDRLVERLRSYHKEQAWFTKTHGSTDQPKIAYFSAEYGLDECLAIYSGGLGILAGDHLKSASELGIPLIGVGLLYQKGYFKQYLNPDGWQQETYPINDFFNLPLNLVHGADGKPLRVSMEFPGRQVHAQVWQVRVGRIRLMLLDTNIAENAPPDRAITDELYGGDKVHRLQQEIVLGIGGMRMLMALGWDCLATHLNEGHSAFCTLERIRVLVNEHKLPLCQAFELIRKSTVFTTHTPVPAGIDEFPEPLMREYFANYARALGMTWHDFMALGRLTESDGTHSFNMARLALNLSYRTNGVSKLHGEVSRRMWHYGWPDLPLEETPIASVTNGIHSRSWLSYEMSELFDRYLGPAWVNKPADQTIWERVNDIPDEELWRTHERRRERLVAFARRRLMAQLKARGATEHEVRQAAEVLDPTALTIGFARRFATYKRATLLFRNHERLAGILSNPEQPIQIIIAGKAHPQDHEGKELIKEIIHFASNDPARRHVVFLENYDMNIARQLVQGVDLWLNTPRRPMEACGTSGMKVVFNGGLNLSILDGWWAEIFNREVGWAIGSGEDYTDWALQDQVEANMLYHLLEDEVAPLFYDRGADGLPRGWITKMRSSMRMICPEMNANRMVREYTERFYLPAIADAESLTRNTDLLAQYCDWRRDVIKNWNSVAITGVESLSDGRVRVGQPIRVKATVNLGSLKPEDVAVQLYIGPLDPNREFVEAHTIRMSQVDTTENGWWQFIGETTSPRSGRFGYSVRVLPSHDMMTHPLELRLVRWPAAQLAEHT